jgi:hypothetical protein
MLSTNDTATAIAERTSMRKYHVEAAVPIAHSLLIPALSFEDTQRELVPHRICQIQTTLCYRNLESSMLDAR